MFFCKASTGFDSTSLASFFIALGVAEQRRYTALANLCRCSLACREAAIRGAICTGGQRSRYLLMQIAVCVAFARACRHSERVLYGVACPPSDVTR